MRFVEHGVWLKGAEAVKLTSNWVHHVIPPENYFGPGSPPTAWASGTKQDEYSGWTGGFTLSHPSNSKLGVRDNVASGAWHHGFHYTPLECDDNQSDLSG